MAAKYHFSFDTTSNWHNLNADFLAPYQVVVLLDTRPEEPTQRNGGFRRTWSMAELGWAFTLPVCADPSAIRQTGTGTTTHFSDQDRTSVIRGDDVGHSPR